MPTSTPLPPTESPPMTQADALRQVRHAKSAHIRWRAYVHALLAGLDRNAEASRIRAPVHHKDCTFGQWFYQEAFRTFGHWRIYQDVDDTHELMHAVYRQLHEAVEAGDVAAASRIGEQLIGLSNALLAVLDVLAEEIREADVL